MNDLIIFEENGKLLTDSRDVARMIEKRHDNLIRDIHGYCKIITELNFEVSEFFIESSYQDSTGRTLPCYQCTKKGCEMIANKMTGKKGVIFTATYVSAFEKMQEFIKGASSYVGIPLKEQVESLEAVANMLRMNDVSKLSMLENFYGSYNIPTDFLPKYVKAERQVFSLTDLLKKNNCEVKPVQFNKMLIDKGYLEERERQSSKGGVKKFKSITDKGLHYGENQKSPHNPRETQPLWYEDTFMELYCMVVG